MRRWEVGATFTFEEKVGSKLLAIIKASRRLKRSDHLLSSSANFSSVLSLETFVEGDFSFLLILLSFCNGWGRKTTQILPLNVKDRNYSTSGPSPPSIQRVSTYLCEFMPSYCTPNPGVSLFILLYIGHLTKGHKNPS